MTTSTVDATPQRAGYFELWRATPATALVLVFVAVPVSLIVMLFLSVVFFPGAGLALLLIGLPVMAFALYSARVFAERWTKLLELTGVRIAIDPVVTSPADAGGRWGAVLWPLRSQQHWLALIHGGIIAPLISVVTFGVSACWIVLAVGGTTRWLWAPLVPEENSDQGMKWILSRIAPDFAASGDASVSITLLVIGGVCLITLPLVLRGLALLHRGSIQAMLLTDAPSR